MNYRLHAIPIKILMTSFTKLGNINNNKIKTITKFHVETQKTKIVKATLSQKAVLEVE